MFNKTLIITIFSLLTIDYVVCQKEANYWYFGDNAGINFNSGKPVAITDSKMYTSEGCATQSNSKGRLLFYTNGNTVWDSTHNIMPNGTGLLGSSSTTQSVIIIPKPFSKKLFYIFTADNVGGADGITYSEVNMSNNMGKGDVTYYKKNKKLLTPACEKITAIRHANGFDYWILVHKFNSDQIYAYKVTGYGVINQPVISKTGLTISGIFSNTLGYLKFSPDGRKIVYANYSLDSTVMGDFDANTGIVSNVWTFRNEDAYGIEFSPKSKYLYVGEFSTKKIFQYDGKATSKQAFLASKTTIDSNYLNNLGALQLGPDGKLYIAVTGSQYLQVIHAPDSFGYKSRPQKNFVFLGGKTCLLGLPNFSSSIFNFKSFSVQRNCLNDSTTFTISNTYDIDSVHWNFGDPQSGSNNYSKKTTNIYHIYNKTGFYTVSLFYFYKKTIGYKSTKFYVNAIKPDIGNDSTFCNAFSITLMPQRDYTTYKWNNNEITKAISITQRGTYILFVKDSVGCLSSDTVIIKNPIIKADFSISDSIQCDKNNVFVFKDISIYDEDSPKQSTWLFGDGTSLTDSMAKKEYASPGIYTIKLNISSSHNCSSFAEKTVTVLPSPIAQYIATSPCFPDGVQFSNQSSVTQGKIISYLWEFGDNTYSEQKNPIQFYKEASKYSVMLTVISDNGCIDSFLKRKGVWVKQKPKAAFNFTEISAANNGQRTIQFNNLSSNDVQTNNWEFGKGMKSEQKEPILFYRDSGENKFVLKVTNDVGCTDTFSITTYNKFYFFLPNAFSPNANGINETFNPVSSLYVHSYKMEIYNLWGEKLFETNDLSNGWDGNYMGKPCPDDYYICKIILTPFNSIPRHYEGNLRLMR